MSFKDRCYCASPNCINECGRKMTEDEKRLAAAHGELVSYAYFCDVPEEYNHQRIDDTNDKEHRD